MARTRQINNVSNDSQEAMSIHDQYEMKNSHSLRGISTRRKREVPQPNSVPEFQMRDGGALNSRLQKRDSNFAEVNSRSNFSRHSNFSPLKNRNSQSPPDPILKKKTLSRSYSPMRNKSNEGSQKVIFEKPVRFSNPAESQISLGRRYTPPGNSRNTQNLQNQN